MKTGYNNVRLIIQFVEYYEALKELADIWWKMRKFAIKLTKSEDVSEAWITKRIRSLARDGFDVFHVKLFANEVYLQSLECEYPGSEKAIETLDKFKSYLNKVSTGEIPASKILYEEWGGILTHMIAEVFRALDDMVPPKEYVEPIRAMRDLKSTDLDTSP